VPRGTHRPPLAGQGLEPKLCAATRASAEVVVDGDDREDVHARARSLVGGCHWGDVLFVVEMMVLLGLVMSAGDCVHLHVRVDADECVWTEMVWYVGMNVAVRVGSAAHIVESGTSRRRRWRGASTLAREVPPRE